MDTKLGLLSICAIALLGLAGCEWRGENDVYDESDGNGLKKLSTYDTDNDSYLDKNELCRGVEEAGLFDEWDINNTNIVEADEFSRGAFEIWDEDGNGILERTEWSRYSEHRFGSDRAFGEWDLDNSGGIDELEFQSGVTKHNVLDKWDRNRAGLNEDEFCEMVYSVADANNDGRIDRNEWGRFS